MNIHQKLLEIQRQVLGLKADKAAYGYSYTDGEKVINAVKPLMNSLGLLLVPEVLDQVSDRQDYKNAKGTDKSEMLYKLKMRFTWVDTDSEQTLPCLWESAGMNDWDKGIGSALTYAERYFLLKFFHIDTSKDDIDNAATKEEVLIHIKESKTIEELTVIWQSIDKPLQEKVKKEFSEKKRVISLINEGKEVPKTLKEKHGL